MFIPESVHRYNGLDALRGIAMLLGIVLHAALPYMPDVEAFWPVDESSSQAINVIFQFIHIWRMPLFFILSGFFARLIISKKSWKGWWRNRALRIGLPIVVFFPIMSLTLPWIFKYGWTGDFEFFYSDEGQPFHLWFLWHLMMFVIFTAIFRLPYILGSGVLNRHELSSLGRMAHKLGSISTGILFRTRFPVLFIIFCYVVSLPTQGELIVNPVATGLYFSIGYTFYRNTHLFSFLKAHWRYYFFIGLVGFILYMVLESRHQVTNIYIDELTGEAYLRAISEPFTAVKVFIKVTCGLLFSYSFIGLSEARFSSYNAKLRFVSDGAYWMYLIHLPVVAAITFLMFRLHMPIEIKFGIAIVMTSICCLVTYKYLVRSTFIGLLLNGKRHPFRS